MFEDTLSRCDLTMVTAGCVAGLDMCLRTLCLGVI